MTVNTVRCLSMPVELEERPVRWRIGLLALATDHTLERDVARICGGDEIAVYVTRVAFANPMTAENLRAMGPRLTQAAELILPDEDLDALAYGCTSASVAMGDAAVAAAIHAAKPGYWNEPQVRATRRFADRFSSTISSSLRPATVTLQASGLTAKYSRYSHLVEGIMLGVVGSLLVRRPEWLMFG